MRTLFLMVFLFPFVAAEAQPELTFTPMTLTGPGLVQPLDITGCGDGSGRLFVTLKGGYVRIIQNGEVLSDYFMDIHTKVINSGERGLLGLAFHPQYPDSPYIYVNYVISGSIINRISRFTLNPENPNDIDENTELILVEQAGVQSNHKAGDLAFGPDGYLYFGMGDGGGGGDPSNAGQDNETMLGKILRIDINSSSPPLNYSIPADNPFVDAPGLNEIWANGIRNPWRISFDRLTGDFWIADVGQNLWEEIDMVPAGTPGGMNFGWDCREGNHNFEPQNCQGSVDFTWPIFEYPHSCNPCPDGRGASLTGGFVYRGNDYPSLQGYYICADYVSNYYWIIKQTGTNPLTFDVTPTDGSGKINALVTFGEDDNGELYASNLNGTIYRVGIVGPPPLQWNEIEALIVKGGNEIDWTTNHTTDVELFEVQRSFQSDFEDYTSIAEVTPEDGLFNYQYIDPFIQPSYVYYRIGAKRMNGSYSYSPVVRIAADPVSRPSLIFEPNTNLWRISLPDPWQKGEVLLYDVQGKEIYKRKLSVEPQVVLTPPIIPGLYIVEIRSASGVWSDQVIW